MFQMKEENDPDILASFLEYFSNNKLDSDLMHVQVNCMIVKVIWMVTL